jgi:hypothetical protein
MLGIIALNRGLFIQFVLLIIIACLFHKSAMILLPLAIFLNKKNRLSVIFIILISGFLLFFLLLQKYIDYVNVGYIGAKYNSSGALIRVAMNALPATIFLYYKERFKLTDIQLGFWSCISYVALGFIALLALIPSSTLIDRLALYFIPLQIFVFSRFPEVFGKTWRTGRIFLVIGVIAYVFAVQFVWLFFGEHAYAWLPYKFYLWEWLWS